MASGAAEAGEKTTCRRPNYGSGVMGREKPLGGVQEAIWWTEVVQIRSGMLLPVVTSFHYASGDPYAARISFHPRAVSKSE